jgi:hypothetical protein
MTLGDALMLAAGTIDYWSTPVAMLLGVLVLGILWFVAAAWGEE